MMIHKLATLETLTPGTRFIDKKGRVGVVIEDDGELFFEFQDSNLLVRVHSKEIYGRQIKILENI